MLSNLVPYLRYGVIQMTRKVAVLCSDASSEATSFVISAVFFACGAIAGTISAGYAADSIGQLLGSYFSEYVAAIENGQIAEPRFWDVFWSVFKPNLVAVFLGFSVFGFLLLPILSAVKGFMLSFAVACMLQILGKDCWLLAFAVYGIEALMSIPCFFILTVRASFVSKRIVRAVLSGGGMTVHSLVGRGYLRVHMVCVLILLTAVVIEVLFVPKFVEFAVSVWAL